MELRPKPGEVDVELHRLFRDDGIVELPWPFGMNDFQALRVQACRALDEVFDSSPSAGSNNWLAGFDRRMPLSAELVVDRPELGLLADVLLGRASFPCPPEVGFLSGRTPWHYDDPLGVVGVKFILYLERQAPSGCLTTVPRSHRDPLRSALEQTRQARAGPLIGPDLERSHPSLETRQAAMDEARLVALDLHLWHEYAGTENRVIWCPEFVALPESADERMCVTRKLEAIAAPDLPAIASGANAVWRDLLARPRSASLSKTICALEQVGAFENGWGAM